MGKGVSLGVSSSWFMCEVEVETAEIKGPLGLTTGKDLSCSPVLKIPMVGDDVKGEGKFFKVVSPVFEGLNDGEHFFVIDLVVSFSVDYRFQVKGNEVPKIVVKLLKEHTTCGEARGVNFKVSWSVGVPHG
jgi:hypothetical protein